MRNWAQWEKKPSNATCLIQIYWNRKDLENIESEWNFISQIEETFGVDASAPVGGAVMMMGQEMLIGTGYRGDIPCYQQPIEWM